MRVIIFYANLLGFNDEEFAGLDYLKVAGLHGLIVDKELQFGIVQNVETLKKEFPWAFNLKDFNFIVEDALGRYEFAKPACLQVKHVRCVILKHVEQADLRK